MFGKILFATDFSEYAKKILDYIGGFPGTREILLLHVLEKARSPRGGGELSEILSENDRIALREEKHSLETLGKHLKVTTVVKTSSDIAGAILETAEEQGVSLIVVGARGKSLMEDVLLGSVSIALLRRSRVNVMIMRHKFVEGLSCRTFAMSCPVILSRVLCPIDFSLFSDYAVALLPTTGGVGEVILLNVVSQGETAAEIDDAVEKATIQMEAIRRHLAAKGLGARVIVRKGNPGLEITKVADEEDVSLIWMSSHGKGWFRELLVGSTAYTVAMNGKKPVLIIRKPDEEASHDASLWTHS